MTIGNTDENATSSIFDMWSMPNQRMKIGRNAIFGAGKARLMNGSRNQRVSALRAIAMPAATPTTAASSSPANAR
jgi:hypothetical protein